MFNAVRKTAEMGRERPDRQFVWQTVAVEDANEDGRDVPMAAIEFVLTIAHSLYGRRREVLTGGEEREDSWQS